MPASPPPSALPNRPSQSFRVDQRNGPSPRFALNEDAGADLAPTSLAPEVEVEDSSSVFRSDEEGMVGSPTPSQDSADEDDSKASLDQSEEQMSASDIPASPLVISGVPGQNPLPELEFVPKAPEGGLPGRRDASVQVQLDQVNQVNQVNQGREPYLPPPQSQMLGASGKSLPVQPGPQNTPGAVAGNAAESSTMASDQIKAAGDVAQIQAKMDPAVANEPVGLAPRSVQVQSSSEQFTEYRSASINRNSPGTASQAIREFNVQLDSGNRDSQKKPSAGSQTTNLDLSARSAASHELAGGINTPSVKESLATSFTAADLTNLAGREGAAEVVRAPSTGPNPGALSTSAQQVVSPQFAASDAAEGAMSDDVPASVALTRRALRSLGRGHGGATVVQLRPAQFGKVTVRVQVEEGRVHADLVARTPEAARVLGEHLRVLRDSLEQKGFVVDRLEVREEAKIEPSRNLRETDSETDRHQSDSQRGRRDGDQQQEHDQEQRSPSFAHASEFGRLMTAEEEQA